MKKRIALAEDDEDILFTITMMLENAGYEVEASNSARYILQNGRPHADLFILDKRMPEMDGLDVCRQLRDRPEYRDTPIIIISASPKFGPQALSAGANDFLEKPFHMQSLLGMVEKYLRT
jgi:two-component system alkaline phosphatase synthesis response regulator PhoP